MVSSASDQRLPKSTSNTSIDKGKTKLDENRRSLPDALQAQLNMFSLESYAAEHFQRRKEGLVFRRKVPVEALATWQEGPLLGSLLALRRIDQISAIKAFQHIQSIMQSSVAAQDALSVLRQQWSLYILGQAQILLDLGVRKAELRDEIYLQLLKQLSRNPSL